MPIRRFTVRGLDADSTVDINLRRCYNLGFTIRDPVKMQAHLEECYRLGVKELVCDRPPLVMPTSAWAVLTDDCITVQRPKTSGEVEIVTVQDADGTVYVGVGSDHTDRSLETIDIPWAKQVAPNIVAPTLWRWTDVKAHWDQVRMDCHVVDGGQDLHYQTASVAEFWTPEEMLHGMRASVTPVDGAVILFSGTVVSIEETLRFAERWTITMTDPVLDRTIEHSYRVEVLAPEVLNDGSATRQVASAASLVG
jgi:hypothetical protein